MVKIGFMMEGYWMNQLHIGHTKNLTMKMEGEL